MRNCRFITLLFVLACLILSVLPTCVCLASDGPISVEPVAPPIGAAATPRSHLPGETDDQTGLGDAVGCLADMPNQTTSPRPNIVWIVVDDMSPNFSCYGETLIQTPHVDRLAETGTRFLNAFTTAPVCSPCRSALITGCYQTTIGAHHHRSGRGAEKIHLPEGVEPLPAIMQRAGYYTCIGGPSTQGTKNLAKTDYNFEWDQKIYDGNDWAGRKAGQPFFMQVQLHGGKHREGAKWSERAANKLAKRVNPDDVTLPPYYPRDPVLLTDWAQYLDTCVWTDLEVGAVLDRLRNEGLLDSTVVFFVTDHGISHARGKQFLYDEGLRVPLIIAGPSIPSGGVRSDFAELIDLAPTTLGLAHIPIPKDMQGLNLFDPQVPHRSATFAARDRCDETVEQLRSIRTDRFKYIRNGYPARPHLQPNAYKDAKPIVIRLRELHEKGQLNALQEKLLFSNKRSTEELYDLHSDPFELKNLASNSQYEAIRNQLRERLQAWQGETRDQGRTPESNTMFDSDMAVYLKETPADRKAILERNIHQMKVWQQTGK